MCWTGGGKDDKPNRKFFEKAWVLNIHPKDIQVLYTDGDKLTDAELLPVLSQLFPDSALLSDSDIEDYEKLIKAKQRPWFDIGALWKAKDKPSSELGWQEVDRLIAAYFPDDFDSTVVEQPATGSSRKTDEHLKNLHLRAAQTGASTELLRAYYGVDDLDASPTGFYAFELEGRPIRTSVLTKIKWLDLSLKLTLDGDNYVLHDGAPNLPDIALPREPAKRLAMDLKHRETKLVNRNAFRLISIGSQRAHPRFTFSEMRYLQHKLTSGLLEPELRDALFTCNFNVQTIMRERQTRLPLRDRLLPNIRSILQFSDRVCTGGVAAVLAIATGDENDEFLIPIYRRSGKVARNPFMLSIAPSGVHSAEIEVQREVNIICTIFREFFEELQKGEDTGRESISRLKWDWYFSLCPALVWLREHPDSWCMECVTFSLNSFSGGYGFGVLWIIQDPEFWKTYGGELSVNWEISEVAERLHSKDTSAIARILTKQDWADECQMIMVECIMRLAKKFPNKCRIPSIERVNPY